MKFKLLNLNLWLIPRPFSIQLKQRVHGFLSIVEDLQPDVINLQEVWTTKWVNYLKGKLKGYHLISNHGLFYNTKGLVIFSKIKPKTTIKKQLIRPRQQNLLESLIGRGYIAITLPVNEKLLTIYNTHLYSPIFKGEEKLTIRQFKELKRSAIRQNLILSGDLNLPRPRLLELNQNYFVEDGIDEFSISEKNYYQNVRINMLLKGDLKTDYILHKAESLKIKLLNAKLIKQPEVSDHYPLFAEFEIK